jgi:hypothetical protein
VIQHTSTGFAHEERMRRSCAKNRRMKQKPGDIRFAHLINAAKEKRDVLIGLQLPADRRVVRLGWMNPVSG